MERLKDWSDITHADGKFLEPVSLKSYTNPWSLLFVESAFQDEKYCAETVADTFPFALLGERDLHSSEASYFVDGARQGSTQSIRLDIICEINELGTESCSSEVLVDYIKTLKELIFARNYSTLDKVLRHIKFEETAPEIIIATLRTTFPVKSHLKTWRVNIMKAYQELNSRGLDADKILIGLL